MAAIDVGGGADEHPVRGRDVVGAKDLLRARLVEAERQRERVAAGVGDAVELADRRDVRLAVRAAQPLGDVEDDVGALRAQSLGKVVASPRGESPRRAARARWPRRRSSRRSPTRRTRRPAPERPARRPPRARRRRYWAALRRRATAPRLRQPPRARASGCTRNRYASSRPYCGIPLARARPLLLRAGGQVARH